MRVFFFFYKMCSIGFCAVRGTMKAQITLDWTGHDSTAGRHKKGIIRGDPCPPWRTLDSQARIGEKKILGEPQTYCLRFVGEEGNPCFILLLLLIVIGHENKHLWSLLPSVLFINCLLSYFLHYGVRPKTLNLLKKMTASNIMATVVSSIAAQYMSVLDKERTEI